MNGGLVLRRTYSVCPVCKKRVRAWHVKRGELIFLEKECYEHGFFSTVIWRGYRDIEKWCENAPELTLEKGDNCPGACGLCSNHQNSTCCVLLEVTRRCNLNCPFCFAHGGEGDDRPLPEIKADLKELAVGGQTLVQLSGGEPTVRDDLPDIVHNAKQAGCRYVQLNTNGIRLGEDKDYVRSLKDAGLSFVFMQFDGVDDTVYRSIRGRDLFHVKQKAIENCGACNIGVTLVPTVVRGRNSQQIGDILRFAVSHSPDVRGVHFQPVSFFGRTPESPTNDKRYTLDELLQDIVRQTSGLLGTDTLLPSRCDHPLCGFHGDFVVLPDRTLYALSGRQDGAKTATAARNRAFVARRWDRSRGDYNRTTAVRKANFNPSTLMKVGYPANVSDVSCCGERAVCAYERNNADNQSNGNEAEQFANLNMADMDEFLSRIRTHGFTVTAMAFQDAGNLDLERLKRCSLHVFHKGLLIPFCKYYL